MVKKCYSFELKNDLSELQNLCQNCEEIGRSINVSDKSIFEMNLALDELFTNIISYGFNDCREHIIKISITVDGDQMEMRIEDDGIPFNPLESKTPDFQCGIEDCKIGGLGIHLIKKLMDDLQYQRVADKNILVLKRKLQKAG
ncbi:MAG: ATP-binding protein [Deltaproteobacteria bacterium]|nr:ATP-binding protein [Deltaproteobacteria bacterium]